MKKFVLFCVLSLFSSQLFAEITVSGEGKVSTVPDVAYISFAVNTQSKEAAEAVTLNRSRSAELYKLFKNETYKIDAKDIETGQYSVTPQYSVEGVSPVGTIDRRPRDVPVVIGYIATNSVKVTVRDLSKVGQLIDDAVKSGANSVSNLVFDVCDKEIFLTQARVLAMKNAKNKAQILAGAVDEKVGRALNISENSYRQPIQQSYRSAVSADSAGPTVLSAGSQDIGVVVTVVFEIEKSIPNESR